MKNTYKINKKTGFLLGICCVLFANYSFAQLHFKVTSAEDHGVGSSVPGELRWAINQASGTTGSFIDFEINEICPVIINLIDPLPAIAASTIGLTIDGNTQPAGSYSGVEPKVWINGAGITSTASSNGFELDQTQNITIKGLSIQNFNTGIWIDFSNNNNIFNNVIFNTEATVRLFGDAEGNKFYGNIFGSNRSGLIHYTGAGNTPLNISSNIIPQENFIFDIKYNWTPDLNRIGGIEPGMANEFWNMSDPVNSLRVKYGRGNRISGNLFKHAVLQGTDGNINLKGNNSNNFGNVNYQAPLITQAKRVGNDLEVTGTSGDLQDSIEVFLTTKPYNFERQVNPYLNPPVGNNILRQNWDVEKFIGYAKCTQIGNSGPINWKLTVPFLPEYADPLKTFAATASDEIGNTSDFSTGFDFEPGPPPCCKDAEIGALKSNVHLGFLKDLFVCSGYPLSMSLSTSCQSYNGINLAIDWQFNDGTQNGTTSTVNHIFSVPGMYEVTVTVSGNPNQCTTTEYKKTVHVMDCPVLDPCESCIGSFAPEPGIDYIVSAWVKEENAPLTKTSYDKPSISLLYTDVNAQPPAKPTTIFGNSPLRPKGLIIDGWQRIEEVFKVPTNATVVGISLESVNGSSFFDDVRVFPLNGNMKSYVYDPVSMKLVAELDENNYATFYEYDEEGKLIRLKKETERGIMTVKENRNNTVKRQ